MFKTETLALGYKIASLLFFTAMILAPREIFAVTNSTQHLLINEVYFNPEGSDYPNEWIEIFNPLEEPVDLHMLGIEAGGASFKSVATIEEHIAIGGNEYFLICESNVNGCDYYVEKLGLQNGGSATDGVRIVRANDVVIDTVLYDSPNSNNLEDDRQVIAADIECATPGTAGNSSGRINSQDTDISSHDFLDLNSPTPGEANVLDELSPSPSISEVSYANSFVEILATKKQNLLSWHITFGNGEKHYLQQLNTGHYQVFDITIPQKESCVYLYSPTNQLMDTLCYSQTWDLFSFCRLDPNDTSAVACISTHGGQNSVYIPDIQTILSVQSEFPSTEKLTDLEFCVFPYDERTAILVDNSGGIRASIGSEILLTPFLCYEGLLVRNDRTRKIEYIYTESDMQLDDIIPMPISIKTINEGLYGKGTYSLTFNNNPDYAFFDFDGLSIRIKQKYLDETIVTNPLNTPYLIQGAIIIYSRATTTQPKYELIPYKISLAQTTDNKLATSGHTVFNLIIVLSSTLVFAYFIICSFSGTLYVSNFTK